MASHEELIKAGSFDEKFKNALRDYYTYGFKTYTELQTENEKGKLEPSESTINADWMRLNNILFDYFDWSIDKKKAFFMSADSQSMVENPFHRVFRFCKYNSEDPKAFFNIVFALSSKMELVTSYLNQQLFDILDIDLEKEAEKRSRIQAVDFLIAYPTAELIQEGEKKFLASYSTDASEKERLSIAKKDEKYIETLLKYTHFFQNHSDCKIRDDMGDLLRQVLSDAISLLFNPVTSVEYVSLPICLKDVEFDWTSFIQYEFPGKLYIEKNILRKTKSAGTKQPKIRKNCGSLVLCGQAGDMTHAVPLTSKNIDLVRSLLEFNGQLASFRKECVSIIKSDLEDCFQKLQEDLQNHAHLSSSQIQCFYSSNVALFTGDNNAINNKLEELKKNGILSEQSKIESVKKKPETLWSLSSLSLAKVLEGGKLANPLFVNHLTNALDFFSKYSELGVIGSFILSRYSHNEKSALRFKHEYFMQSLNDYNLIDLLYAIEENYWCKIDYKHAVSGRKTSIICYPLEIRISSSSGREYLSYYEPFTRSYSNLRMEFIDSIEYIRDGDITTSDGKKVTVQDESIKADIKNARKSLIYSWGVSTTINQMGNAIKEAPLYDIWLKIAFDPENETFIRNRLYREQRIGNVHEHDGYIEFTVQVTDVRELRPWIRSFYSRLVDFSGIEKMGFSIKEDLTEIKYSAGKSAVPVSDKTIDDTTSPTHWFIPANTVYKTFSCEAHQLLFNEYFSIYYSVISDVLMSIYANKEKEFFTESEVRVVINSVLNKHLNIMGMQSRRLLSAELKELLTSNAFLHEGIEEKLSCWMPGSGIKRLSHSLKGKPTVSAYLRKYRTAVDSFYFSILPLSVLECRWLVTIIDNPKIKLFLSDAEIQYLKEVFTSGKDHFKRLPLGAIYYTDRFRLQETARQKEIEVMNALLSAIQHHKKVFVEYTTAHGKRQKGVFAPVVIEFSKRDNLFRGYFLSMWNKKICIMNIARVDTLKALDEEFDYEKAILTLERFREKNTREITVEFYDVKNTADRILSEFAPWKKQCSYDRETKLYRLTLYYQKQDSYEIVVRLLGYGATIRILEQDNLVFEQYSMRIDKQVAIERERGTEKAKEQSRNDDTEGI